MTQLRLPGMPVISPLDDYDNRLLRDRPDEAGELMADGLSTICEFYFLVDCIVLPVAAQRMYSDREMR